MPGVAVFVVVGLGAGLLSGLFGVGGGMVIVPALALGMGFAQPAAVGTSLVALLLPVGLGGVWAYWQQGVVGPTHLRAGLWIAGGMLAGSFLGAKLALALPVALLKRLFAAFLLVVAARTFASTL